MNFFLKSLASHYPVRYILRKKKIMNFVIFVKRVLQVSCVAAVDLLPDHVNI